MRGLDGKVVLIAGGAGGIGAATTRRLAEEGARVVVADIDKGRADALAKELRESGAEASGQHLDLASSDSCEAAVDSTVDTLGRIDGLFNVGADLRKETLGRDRDLLTVPEEVWQRTLDVNLTGYFRMTRAALRPMLDQGAGAIVQTLTGLVFYGDPTRPAYGASKGGVIAMTRHVAARWGKVGIRCNAVAPGLVMTEMASEMVSTEEQERILAGNRSTRLGRPSDIASMVAFLLSDDSEWINGEMFMVTGGRAG